MSLSYKSYKADSFKDFTSPSVSYLQKALEQDKLHLVQDVLFYSSLGGVGKTVTANFFAKAVICNHRIDGSPCNQCDNCHLANTSHPDIVHIDGAKLSDVKAVEDLIIPILRLKPIKAHHKIIILDEAHRLPPSVQSALLTLVENPNRQTFFLLTTTEINDIIQPLQTRFFLLELSTPSFLEMAKIALDYLKEHKINLKDEAALRHLVISSNGSIRQLKKECDKYVLIPNLNHQYTEILEIFESKTPTDLYQNLFRINDVITKFKAFLISISCEFTKIQSARVNRICTQLIINDPHKIQTLMDLYFVLNNTLFQIKGN